MFDRVDLKRRAKEYAFNHKWDIWKGFLLAMVVSFAASMVASVVSQIFITNIKGNAGVLIGSLITFACTLATLPLQIGLYAYVLGLVREQDPDLVDCLFKFYKDGRLWYIIKNMLLIGIFYILLSLLLIIPGIIYMFMMIMVPYLLADMEEKDIENTEVRQVSKNMMNGHKWEYFVLQLSFILWYIGCSFTFGILAIWFMPYYITTNTMYYEDLKKLSK